MGMYVPPYVKKKGAYGADQTEKGDAFRAERTVKLPPPRLYIASASFRVFIQILRILKII